MAENDWVSISEAARRLSVSRATIHRRVAAGLLPHRFDNRGQPQVHVGQPTQAAPQSEPLPEARQPLPGEPEMIPAAIHREMIEALQRASGELAGALYRQIAVERRRADVAEARLLAELGRKLTVLERLTGRRVVTGQVVAGDEIACG